MSLERANVIEKIKKLVARTTDKGCTEAEAMQAATKIGELMQTYDLTMDKIFLGEAKCIEKRIQLGSKRQGDMGKVVCDLADFCDCKVWVTHFYPENTDGSWGHRQLQYHFFGLEMDVEMLTYLYGVIFIAIKNHTEDFKSSELYVSKDDGYSNRKLLSSSFKNGMQSRIADRLRQMKDDRHHAESVATENVHVEDVLQNVCTDIVLLKQNKVDDEFEKLGIKISRGHHIRSRRNYEAFSQGKAAAEKVNLGRPLGSRSTGLLSMG